MSYAPYCTRVPCGGGVPAALTGEFKPAPVGSQLRNLLLRLVRAPLLWAGMVLTAHAGEEVPLVDALAALREQGYEIVYSNDLVTSSLRIDVVEVTFDAVLNALSELGLELVRSGAIWLVVRDPAAAPPAAPVRSVVTDAETRIDAIETVIVTGSRHRVPSGLNGASAATVTAAEMDVTPALAGDAMRVVNRLPGMSSVGISAKPLVRGGVDNETLIVIDGIELLDPFHLADFQSIFSSVDDRTVDAIDVYTGGFPARYGNRMSGVMAISTLSEDATPRTELGLSLFSAFVNTRGSSADGDTTWLGSARRGNLHLLVEWLDEKYGSPKYDDAYARISRRLNGNVTVHAGVQVSRDDISVTDNEEVATSDIDTTYFWTRADMTHGESLESATILTYVTSDREKTEQNAEPDVSVGFLDYTQEARKYTLRSDLVYREGAVLMEFGIAGEYGDSHYDSTALIDRGVVAELLGDPELDAFDIHTDPSGWSGGAYWSGEFLLGDRFAVQPGLRWDFQDYYASGLDTHVSPRLGVRYALSDTVTLRSSVGRYYQPEAIHEMKVTDGVDHFLAAQRADHVIGSVDWDANAGTSVRAEAYYKDYQPTRTRFENLFNTFVLLPELEPDRVALTPSRARVEGIDLQARFPVLPSLTGVLRGSYMNADDRIDGTWVARKWSQHYTAQGMLAWQHEFWSAAAAFTWHSGWRTTGMPGSVPIGTVIPLASILNNAILDDYVSIDISMKRTWRVGRASITASVDLTNISNHENLAGIDYIAEETATDVLLTPDEETLLPWIPSVGVIVSF
jgi:outer membrane receptor protein involved in Fe transport